MVAVTASCDDAPVLDVSWRVPALTEPRPDLRVWQADSWRIRYASVTSLGLTTTQHSPLMGSQQGDPQSPQSLRQSRIPAPDQLSLRSAVSSPDQQRRSALTREAEDVISSSSGPIIAS